MTAQEKAMVYPTHMPPVPCPLPRAQMAARGYDYVRFVLLEGRCPQGILIARRSGKWLILRSGRESPEYDYVRTPVLSRDGKHLAYVAERGGREFLVVNGCEGPQFDRVGLEPPRFDVSGSGVLYRAERRGRWVRAEQPLPPARASIAS